MWCQALTGCPWVARCHFLFLSSQTRCTWVWLEIHRCILHFLLFSTDQKIKTHNTIPLHTLASFSSAHHTPPYFPIACSHFDFLSVGLFLSHFSLSAVMQSLIHTPFFFVKHITGSPPLQTAHIGYSRFAAGGWDMLIYKHRKAYRCLDCMHTALYLIHTCTQTVPAPNFYAGRNYELLP